MQVLDLHSALQQVVRQVFRHLLGQRGHQNALVSLGASSNLREEIIDLPLGWLDHNLGIDESCGANDLFNEPVGLTQLVVAGGGREVDRLPDAIEELLPPQRSIVHRTGQPEPVLHQRALAGGVSLEHGADLRNGLVGLIDHQEEVLGEVVDQRVRCRPRFAAIDVARIVLDP